MAGYQFRGKINIQAALSKSKGWTETDPSRFVWKMNDKGMFFAVMKLLPAPDTDIGFVKVQWHRIKDSHDRDINLACPKMAGLYCPICSYVNYLFNKGDDRSRKLGTEYNSSKTYYANVLIRKNDANPDTVGKVFVFRYTREINKLITTYLEGNKDEDIPPQNVFAYDNDMYLYFKAVMKASFPSYSNSKFEKMNPLTEEEAIACDKQLHNLNPILEASKSKIRSTPEIVDIFNRATGINLYDYIDPIKTVSLKKNANDDFNLAGQVEENPDEDDSDIIEHVNFDTAKPKINPENKMTKKQKEDDNFWGEFDKD